jgi:hypothetical protein
MFDMPKNDTCTYCPFVYLITLSGLKSVLDCILSAFVEGLFMALISSTTHGAYCCHTCIVASLMDLLGLCKLLQGGVEFSHVSCRH